MKNSSTQSRMEYIDLTKLFAIYCVLWGHSIELSSSEDRIAAILCFRR
jgi:hypothetical protein